jgi:hypothetical protein
VDVDLLGQGGGVLGTLIGHCFPFVILRLVSLPPELAKVAALLSCLLQRVPAFLACLLQGLWRLRVGVGPDGNPTEGAGFELAVSVENSATRV